MTTKISLGTADPCVGFCLFMFDVFNSDYIASNDRITNE
jgi:hypothetical protein